MKSFIFKKISSDWRVGGLNTFINPFSYMLLRKRPEVISGMDAVMVDGQSLVVILQILGHGGIRRRSFDMTSLAAEVFEWAIENRKRVFLVGTTSELIAEAVKNICHEYPELDIAGHSHGFLKNSTDYFQVLTQIEQSRPDVVVAGMGAPKQEEFLIQLKERGWEGTGFTCGGFFHQTASGIQYYPRWADKLHLRWLYRIYDEPRLFVRYFCKYPIAVYLILWDFAFKSNDRVM